MTTTTQPITVNDYWQATTYIFNIEPTMVEERGDRYLVQSIKVEGGMAYGRGPKINAAGQPYANGAQSRVIGVDSIEDRFPEVIRQAIQETAR